MSIFGKKSGGLMNVIRCDEPDYLVWKWRPAGQSANSTHRENSIRYGSSLRVKEGEVAVFLYKQKDGTSQDFIEGPYDATIKTANFPVLTNIVGMAFGGDSPFQAEVYFINLAGTIQIKFGVPYFDVFDPRFLDFAVPVCVRGAITFSVADYKGFIKLNRLMDFSLDNFKEKVRAAVMKSTKKFVANAPEDNQIPVLQIERKISEISDLIQDKITPEFEEAFGVVVRRFDLSEITVDKDSDGYRELHSVTAEQQKKTISAQTDINIKNLQDTQAINAENMQESLRIQREETQRAQRLQTETNFIGAHALNQQTEVLKAGASSLGTMGNMSGGGDMNPAGLMTGMMMGGALGGQMANMMNKMGQQMNTSATPPSPVPDANVQFMIAENGAQRGPFNFAQLQQLVAQGQMTSATYVWRAGMTTWQPAGQHAELAALFASPTPPPPPPIP